jgi:regulator of sigma E protease
MTIFVAIAGLGLLILIHELGHFGASLALRMRPRRFYIGFPPAIWKIERNGIEYGLGAIPLGGFVKIPGMHRPASADVDSALGRALEEQPGLAGPAERLRLALSRGDHPAAVRVLAEIDTLLATTSLSPAAERAATRGVQDLGDALGPDAYWRAKTWKRIVVIAAGPLANIALAVVLFTALFLSSGGRATTRVHEVLPGSPAAKMGLAPGDQILAIDGTPVEATGISGAISSSGGRALTVLVERGTELVKLGPAAPVAEDGRTYRLGFVLAGERMGAGESVGEALRVTWLVTEDIGRSLARLVTSEGRKDISSPVGIVQGSSDAAARGADSFFWVLGLISLSIALLNLLPLLPLDGGHIVFAVVEGVRGRTVRREIYERVSIVGIGVVVLLFFIGLSNDVNRLS